MSLLSVKSGNPCDVMAKVLDCNFKVSTIILTLGKGLNLFIHPVMRQIVPLLFFYKDCFGIK